MRPGRPVSRYGVVNNTTVHLVPRLPGSTGQPVPASGAAAVLASAPAPSHSHSHGHSHGHGPGHGHAHNHGHSHGGMPSARVGSGPGQFIFTSGGDPSTAALAQSLLQSIVGVVGSNAAQATAQPSGATQPRSAPTTAAASASAASASAAPMTSAAAPAAAPGDGRGAASAAAQSAASDSAARARALAADVERPLVGWEQAHGGGLTTPATATATPVRHVDARAARQVQRARRDANRALWRLQGHISALADSLEPCQGSYGPVR